MTRTWKKRKETKRKSRQSAKKKSRFRRVTNDGRGRTHKVPTAADKSTTDAVVTSPRRRPGASRSLTPYHGRILFYTLDFFISFDLLCTSTTHLFLLLSYNYFFIIKFYYDSLGKFIDFWIFLFDFYASFSILFSILFSSFIPTSDFIHWSFFLHIFHSTLWIKLFHWIDRMNISNILFSLFMNIFRYFAEILSSLVRFMVILVLSIYFYIFHFFQCRGFDQMNYWDLKYNSIQLGSHPPSILKGLVVKVIDKSCIKSIQPIIIDNIFSKPAHRRIALPMKKKKDISLPLRKSFLKMEAGGRIFFFYIDGTVRDVNKNKISFVFTNSRRWPRATAPVTNRKTNADIKRVKSRLRLMIYGTDVVFVFAFIGWLPNVPRNDSKRDSFKWIKVRLANNRKSDPFFFFWRVDHFSTHFLDLVHLDCNMYSINVEYFIISTSHTQFLRSSSGDVIGETWKEQNGGTWLADDRLTTNQQPLSVFEPIP